MTRRQLISGKSVIKGREKKFRRKLERASHTIDYRDPTPNEKNFLERCRQIAYANMARLREESEQERRNLLSKVDEWLTQRQVDSLPDGTNVIIIWRKGSHPYVYEIFNHDGEAHIAYYSRKKQKYLGHRISPVGLGENQVHVSLINEDSS